MREMLPSLPSRLVQMGPSGSGKTTLLDILSGRKTTGTTTGTISFSGSTPSRAFLRRYTGCAPPHAPSPLCRVYVLSEVWLEFLIWRLHSINSFLCRSLPSKRLPPPLLNDVEQFDTLLG